MKSVWSLPQKILVLLDACLAIAIFVTLLFQLNWIALAALGTTGVAIWAVWHQGILAWIDRPVLELKPYKQEPPYFRQADLLNQKTLQKMGVSYSINIPLKNTGKTLAKNCQPIVITMGKIESGKWEQDNNWLPKGLLWTFGGSEGRNLMPDKPDQFSLGRLTTVHPKKFFLSTAYPTTGQPHYFDPGQYCFEVKIFAERTDSITKYFHVYWNGECTDDLEDVKTKIKIFSKDHPPWDV